MKPNYLLMALVFPALLSAQSPGGVESVGAWLQARRVNSHTFISSQKIDASKAIYYTSIGQVNFQPAFSFHEPGQRIIVPFEIDQISRATVFVVYQHDQPAIEQSVWNLGASKNSIHLTTQKADIFPDTLSYKSPHSQAAIINTFINHRQAENTIAGPESGLSLGWFPDRDLPFKGKIPEFIFYDRVLKLSEQRKVETYLAIKYSVTLQHDYISSSNKVLWSLRNNRPYSNRIAGIGVDAGGNLFQKQSEIKENGYFIKLGEGGISSSNDENTSVINDHDFLLFGDDDGVTNWQSVSNPSQPGLLQRRWVMNASGNTASNISTELKIAIGDLFQAKAPGTRFVLAIDRSGTGQFNPAKTEYISASELAEGVLTFKNIFWDTDHSGRDVFTVGKTGYDETGSENPETNQVFLFPNPSTEGFFNLNIHLEKETPVQVEIFDEAGKLVQTFSGKGQRTYFFNGRITGSAGVYRFSIVTDTEKFTRQLVIR